MAPPLHERIELAYLTLDDDTFRLLAMDTDVAVRLAVANQPEIPLDVAIALARDEDARVRGELVRNCPKIPKPLLDELRRDPDPEVAEAAVDRKPSLSGEAASEARIGSIFRTDAYEKFREKWDARIEETLKSAKPKRTAREAS